MTSKKERKVTTRQVFTTIIWPRRKQLFIGLVLIIISRLSGLILPGATKLLIDDVIPSNDLGQLKWLILVVVLAIVVQSITSYSLTQILSVEGSALSATRRRRR